MIQAIVIFAALTATLEFLHFCERKDLYDRLMSRDADEYRRLCGNKKSPDTQRETQHQKAVNEWRKGM